MIYHTHSQEMFADSVEGDASTSIVGIGDYLTALLNDTYHIYPPCTTQVSTT